MKKGTIRKMLTLLIVFSMIFTMLPVNIKMVQAVSDKVNVGDYIYLGTYQGEPIKWRCIGKDSNGKLMLSDKVLCKKSYDAKYSGYTVSVRANSGSNYWGECALRHWLNSEGEVDWTDRARPSADCVVEGDPYDEEQGFLSSFTDSELQCVKTVTQKTYLNNLDEKRADGGSEKLNFNANGHYNNLFKTMLKSDNKWYENITDQFFIPGPEQLQMGCENIGTDYMCSNDSYWLRLPCNTGQSYENVARSAPMNRITHAGAANANPGVSGVRVAFYLNESNFQGDVISGEMSSYFKVGVDTNQFEHEAIRAHIEDKSYLAKLLKHCHDFQSRWRILGFLNYRETGICHGIALSMCYGNQGYIDFDDIKSGAYDYWTLESPYGLANTKMKDMIMYYFMTQCLSDGGPTYSVNKEEGWGKEDLETFLKKFVEEAKHAKNVEKPFVFSYNKPHGEGTSGHSIVVCGYRQSEQGTHEITMFDENSYSEGSKGGYLTMKVSSDFKEFSFADSNARNNDGEYLEDIWTSLKYYGTYKLYNGGIETLQMEDNSKTTIQVSAYKKFRLQNKEGKYLEYDGKNYTGDMEVYSCELSGTESDEPIWNLSVPASDSFALTKAEDGCQFLCEDNNKKYVVTADGADKVTISSGKVKVEGNSYTLSAAMPSKDSDNEILKIDADVRGNSTITQSDKKTSIQFDNRGSNVELTKYVDLQEGTTVSSKDEVTGSNFVMEDLNKKDNKPKLKKQVIKTAKMKTYKAKNLKRKKVTFSLKAKVYGKAKLTYKVTKYPKNAKKYISVSKSGKVTLKKKAKKGTYKIRITAAKTSKYQKATKDVTIKVK